MTRRKLNEGGRVPAPSRHGHDGKAAANWSVAVVAMDIGIRGSSLVIEIELGTPPGSRSG
jgi:hypothetical protein